MQEALGQKMDTNTVKVQKEETITETSDGDLKDLVHTSHEVNVGTENSPIVID